MKNTFLALIVTALIVSLLGTAVANAQGSSFDTAEEIVEKNCVSISSGDEHWYKDYVSIDSTSSIAICVYPSNNLDVDLYVYDSNGTLMGSSARAAGNEDCVTVYGPYDGYIYAKVTYYSGDGVYNIKFGGEPQDPDSLCSASNSGSSGSSNAGGINIPVLSNIVNALNNLVRTIQNFFTSIQNFFNQVTRAINGFFTSLITGIQNTINAIGQVFSNIANGIKNFFTTIWNGIVGFFSNLGRWFVDLFSSLGSAIANFFTMILNGLKNAGETLGNAIKSLGGPFSAFGDWVAHNGLLVIGIILVFIGIVIRPCLYIGAVLSIAGLWMSGFNMAYILVVSGVMIIAVAARRR